MKNFRHGEEKVWILNWIGIRIRIFQLQAGSGSVKKRIRIRNTDCPPHLRLVLFLLFEDPESLLLDRVLARTLPHLAHLVLNIHAGSVPVPTRFELFSLNRKCLPKSSNFKRKNMKKYGMLNFGFYNQEKYRNSTFF